MTRGVHGEKLVAARRNIRLPAEDQLRLDRAIERYDAWVQNLTTADGETLDHLINNMVAMLTEYKFFIDVDVIFDSRENFLYRQKGQLKLDNTVMEEFLPILVRKCLDKNHLLEDISIDIGSQKAVFSSLYFNSSISFPGIGGGLVIKTKNQDFSMSRQVYLKTSYSQDFNGADTADKTINLGYVMAELKTNLDKTMFQEAAATAHDIKLAVAGAKYYLLCDFVDMQPISSALTDIDKVLVMRKAHRIDANIRADFSNYEGRRRRRDMYVNYLNSNPYRPEVFKDFIDCIIKHISAGELGEDTVLGRGWF